MFLLEVTFSQMAIHSDLYLGSDYELYNAFEKTSFHTGVVTIDRNGGLFSFAANASWENSDNTRYLDGSIRKYGPSTFTFPSGHSGRYQPIHISQAENNAFLDVTFVANPHTTQAWSLDDLVNGSGNSALGSYAGENLNTNNSNNNTFIGYRADTTSGTFISNSTAIGASAIVSTSNTFVMGDENVSKWAFGLPTTDTGNAIHVGDNATNGNGASLTEAGVWTNASSILFKTNFIDLDNEWILSKIKSLNVKKWDYKTLTKHI
jgi:hypothetical protein